MSKGAKFLTGEIVLVLDPRRKFTGQTATVMAAGPGRYHAKDEKRKVRMCESGRIREVRVTRLRKWGR